MRLRSAQGLLLSCFASAAVFGLSAIAQAAPAELEVTVSCPAQSVQRALEKKADKLTVLIDGTCNENIVVDRRDVTLRGVATGSGISGIGADPGGDHAVVRVDRASRIRLENLHVSNGSRFGLVVDGGQVTVDNCQFVNNTRAGISVGTGGGVLTATNLTISGGNQGLQVFEAGVAFCTDCDISANDSALLVVSARAYVWDTHLDGGWGGLVVSQNATAAVTGGSVTGGQYAIWNHSQAHSLVDGATLDGGVTAFRGGKIELVGATQNSDPLGGTTIDAASIHLAGSSLLGPLALSRFANGTVDSSSAIGGNLSCTAGGNLHCDDPNDIGGTTTGCALCAKP